MKNTFRYLHEMLTYPVLIHVFLGFEKKKKKLMEELAKTTKNVAGNISICLVAA